MLYPAPTSPRLAQVQLNQVRYRRPRNYSRLWITQHLPIGCTHAFYEYSTKDSIAGLDRAGGREDRPTTPSTPLCVDLAPQDRAPGAQLGTDRIKGLQEGGGVPTEQEAGEALEAIARAKRRRRYRDL
jgi:hypothetical protein